MATINSKNTKAEILAAYREEVQANKNLTSELEQLSDAKHLVQHNDNINNNSHRNQDQNISASNQIVSLAPPTSKKSNVGGIEMTIKSLNLLRTNIGSSISNLSEQLIEKATTLENLQQSITEVTTQLKQLHQINEVKEDTLANLINFYQENDQKFTIEIEQQKENLQQQIQDLQQAWQKEQHQYQQSIKERDTNYQKQQQRETESYQYNLELQRDLAAEAYQQQQHKLYEDLENQKQELEFQWQEREKKISEQEKQYAEAKSLVDSFQGKLAAKVKQGEEEGKGIGYYQAKIKADLREREIAGEKQNYELQIASLQQNIDDQQLRIQQLTSQLEAAQQQVQNLALKAIEGSANRNSFEAMREIAIEQAKTPQKTK